MPSVYTLFDVVTKMIDVDTNSAQTTPTHCDLNMMRTSTILYYVVVERIIAAFRVLQTSKHVAIMEQ